MVHHGFALSNVGGLACVTLLYHFIHCSNIIKDNYELASISSLNLIADKKERTKIVHGSGDIGLMNSFCSVCHVYSRI